MKAPLFILAPPGSLNSLVCAMIGQHPEMYDLPQIKLFAGESYQHLLRKYGSGRFQHGLLRAFAELGLGLQTDRSITLTRMWLLRHCWDGADVLFDALIEWAAPRRVVDASRIYVLDRSALPRIQQAFPNAQYLHLLRHPILTCESIEQRPQRRQIERFWLEPHLDILNFLHGVPADLHVRLRVEDLLSEPDLYLRQIAEWAGVSSTPKAVAEMKHPEQSPFACYGPVNALYGNDTEFLDDPMLQSAPVELPRLQDSLQETSEPANVDELTHYAMLFGYQ